MREVQSFDAFYARTVHGVTSKMRELAGDDPQADHAIREAYARAYQQWFEVSGYRDAEDWVFDTAREAYERRRAEAGPAGSAPKAPDTGTWPGMYRPRKPAADPAATVTGPIGPDSGRPGMPGAASPPAFGPAANQPAGAPVNWFKPAADGGPKPGGQGAAFPSAAGQADPFPAAAQWDSPSPAAGQAGAAAAWDPRYPAAGGQAGPAAPWGSPSPAAGGQAGQFDPAAPWGGAFPAGTTQADPRQPGAGPTATAQGRPSAAGSFTGMLNRPGAGTMLIAVVAVIALLAAGTVAYLAFGRKPAASRTTTPPAAVSKAQPQMLAAGRVGPRSAVPWSLLGPDWVLAEESSAAPDPAGQPTGSGTISTYLVDPKGGMYLIQQWSATLTPTLLAWSGNADTALYVSFTSDSSALSYSLLNLPTGQITQLTLPAGVSVAGFTRPDGLNLVAVQQGPQRFRLQRYSLTGALTAQLSYMPVRGGQPSLSTCGISCGALSSPDGLTAVWAMGGDEMQLVSNLGGIVRRLHVPESGTPPSCAPIRWWGPGMILASCSAPGAAGAPRRLWLVPADGAAPTALTLASGGPAGSGFYTDAWRTGGSIYVTATSPTQCPQAPTGPGGMDILRLSASGTDTPITIPGTTGNHNTIVASGGGRLLVLAQTSCPGTTSLLVFDPADGASRVVLTGTSGQSGVIAALPLGTR